MFLSDPFPSAGPGSVLQQFAPQDCDVLVTSDDATTVEKAALQLQREEGKVVWLDLVGLQSHYAEVRIHTSSHGPHTCSCVYTCNYNPRMGPNPNPNPNPNPPTEIALSIARFSQHLRQQPLNSHTALPQ